MEQKDKDLLLRDLCCRLPYKVMGERIWTAPVTGSPEKGKTVFSNFDIEVITTGYSDCGELGFRKVENYSFKPYLFPLSSMTEEQKKEEYEICKGYLIGYEPNLIDFYLRNHLDYRGLIPMNLAIDCTNLNIY